MASRQKISQMTPKGANLEATDLLEVSVLTGTGYGTYSITGQEIIDAASSGGGVPYTGAIADVDLGTFDLYTNKLWLYDAVNDNYGSIHFTDTDFHIEDADGHKMLVIEDGFMQIHLSDTVQSNLYTSLLTATRDHYLPDASGTIALTSQLLNTNLTSPANGDSLEYNGSQWVNKGIKFTVECMDALTVDFYAPYNLKIQSVTNILNAPTTTLKDDGATYTAGGGATIASGSKITVTVSTAAVVTLNIIKA